MIGPFTQLAAPVALAGTTVEQSGIAGRYEFSARVSGAPVLYNRQGRNPITPTFVRIIYRMAGTGHVVGAVAVVTGMQDAVNKLDRRIKDVQEGPLWVQALAEAHRPDRTLIELAALAPEPCPSPDASDGFDACRTHPNEIWPCRETRLHWLSRGLDVRDEVRRALGPPPADPWEGQ